MLLTGRYEVPRSVRLDTGKATGPDTIAAGPKPRTTAVLASSARSPQTRTSPVGVPLLDEPVVARGVPPATEPTGRTPTTTAPPLPTPLKLGAPEVPVRR